MSANVLNRVRIIGAKGDLQIGDLVPPVVSADVIRTLYPGVKPIVTTDFLVETNSRSPIFTSASKLAGYWCDRGVITVDHHVPDPQVWRHISSTNMAIAFVKEWGPVPIDSPPVLVTHRDADSTLASAILAGVLSTEDRFGEAALDADHRGNPNAIADLLQAIQHGDVGQIGYSFHCLEIMLKKGEKALPKDALHALATRRAEREKIRQVVEKGAFINMGFGVFYGELPDRVDGELLPSLLPEAAVIVVAYPIAVKKMTDAQRQRGAKVYEVKTRTGEKFPAGASLINFGLTGWAGRWNAGGNGRHGGTEDPAGFADEVVEGMKNLLSM